MPPTRTSTQATTSTNTSASPEPQTAEKERSRNAKAQARHREKRKAYIEHLEKSVASLKQQLGTMGISAPIPASKLPSQEAQDENEARLQALTIENERLKSEIQVLRSRIEALTNGAHRFTPPTAEDAGPVLEGVSNTGVPLSLNIPPHMQHQAFYNHHQRPMSSPSPHTSTTDSSGRLSALSANDQAHRMSLPSPHRGREPWTPSYLPTQSQYEIMSTSAVRSGWPQYTPTPNFLAAPSVPPSRATSRTTTTTDSPRSLPVSPVVGAAAVHPTLKMEPNAINMGTNLFDFPMDGTAYGWSAARDVEGI